MSALPLYENCKDTFMKAVKEFPHSAHCWTFRPAFTNELISCNGSDL